MQTLSEAVDAIADETGFAGVVSVDRGGQIEFVKAHGLAHRAFAFAGSAMLLAAIAAVTSSSTVELLRTPTCWACTG